MYPSHLYNGEVDTFFCKVSLSALINRLWVLNKQLKITLEFSLYWW